ncbi:FecR family protein [Runella slithyformis]|uniref:Anti-FecI sigma factor, FecR n=1 Tax=Runella slithyformis (strain ATCC 29530 / DSM 19594 / LMG 11500 / NCIMB 11436 / LSU 4) TaxID=761193 RepID=A0A7U3ZNN1_RUNSL|nr:FecR domain-containing protein [Runella slithyformis]AEI50545.1 anti-FecI sigma factor, FecR [Runella slithyformis DSM 19594]
MNQQTIYRQAIQALFAGRATPLQKALIEEWLSQPAHQELYFTWLEEWERQNPQLIVDVEAAYLRLSDQTREESTGLAPLSIVPRRYSLFLGIAATVLLLAGVSMYILRDSLLYKHYETAYGELLRIDLPDESRVMLNANSSLKVPRFGFGESLREVFLKGEAEFSVKHLPNHARFIVRTPDHLEIQVLGTEFMVYSRARGSKVVLNKGKVQLRSLKNQIAKPLVITSGDVVTISGHGTLTVRHHQPVAVHAGWKEHRFTFENTSVSEIAYQLTEQFGVQIVIADSSLAKRTLGGTFKAETAEAFLNVMAEMLEIRVIHNETPGDASQVYTLTY